MGELTRERLRDIRQRTELLRDGPFSIDFYHTMIKLCDLAERGLDAEEAERAIAEAFDERPDAPKGRLSLADKIRALSVSHGYSDQRATAAEAKVAAMVEAVDEFIASSEYHSAIFRSRGEPNTAGMFDAEIASLKTIRHNLRAIAEGER